MSEKQRKDAKVRGGENWIEVSNVGNKTPRAAGSKRATSRRTQLAFRTPSFAVAFECVQLSQLKVPAAADKQFRATRRPR